MMCINHINTREKQEEGTLVNVALCYFCGEKSNSLSF